MMFRRNPFPKDQSPYAADPAYYIITTDGKRLPIDHTLDMAMEQAIVGDTTVERGLAKALAAALLALKDANKTIVQFKESRDT